MRGIESELCKWQADCVGTCGLRPWQSHGGKTRHASHKYLRMLLIIALPRTAGWQTLMKRSSNWGTIRRAICIWGGHQLQQEGCQQSVAFYLIFNLAKFISHSLQAPTPALNPPGVGNCVSGFRAYLCEVHLSHIDAAMLAWPIETQLSVLMPLWQRRK